MVISNSTLTKKTKRLGGCVDMFAVFCRWERSCISPREVGNTYPLPALLPLPPHHHHIVNQTTTTNTPTPPQPAQPHHHHHTTPRQVGTTTTSIHLLDTSTCCGRDHRCGSRLRGSRAGLSEFICKQHGDKNGAVFNLFHVSCTFRRRH